MFGRQIKMKFTQRFATIFCIILAFVVGAGLLVLTTENAQAQFYRVQKSQLSYDIPVNPNPSGNKEQDFGVFAWQTFVALNWPATCDGSPLKDQKIGEAPSAPRVWESYKHPEDVFNPDSEQPTCPKVQYLRFTEFASNETLENIQKWAFLEYKKDDPNQQLLEIFPNAKSVNIFIEGQKPLVDRQGNYILNEVRMNPVEVAQIVKNRWYDAANLQNFDDVDNPFTLMCSNLKPNGTYPFGSFDQLPCRKNDSVGTIDLKAAWMVLPDSVPDEMRSNYYTTTRTFDVETPESVDAQKTQVTVPVALVGFHVVQKTSQQGWMWATFEHINNAPDANSLPASGDYNLYDSKCTENCEPNTPYVKEPYLWQKEFPHAVTKTQDDKLEKQIPSQITRLVSIPAIAQSLNSEWQEKLAAEVPNSIWRNYQLIGVQWLQNPYLPYQTGSGGRRERPEQLANVTLEPYVQKGYPGNSCVACHSLAKLPQLPTEYPQALVSAHSDFSFLLRKAK